jgi:two-component sensor histidine kinase
MPTRLIPLARRTRAWLLWQRYLATVAIVATAIGTRLVLLGVDAGYPYLTAFPAVILAGLVFDRGCAFLATFLCAVLGVLLFVVPAGSLFIIDAGDAVALVLFVALSLYVAMLIEGLHSAINELGEANRRLACVEKEQDVLLREAAHRRQNDLQRLVATLRLQARASFSEEVRAALSEAVTRIEALSRIDQQIERHRNDPNKVDVHALLSGLVEDLQQAGSGELRPIFFDVSVEACELPPEQAVPLGIIVTELIANALKYAFPGNRPGKISITFRRDSDGFNLAVSDDGIGFDPTAPAQGTGLGSKLVRTLAGQLGGDLEVGAGAAGNGTLVTMRVPASSPTEPSKMRSVPALET